jgi:predicted NBD/HSP70 family sugar kinase
MTTSRPPSTSPSLPGASSRVDQTAVRQTNLGVVLREVARRGSCSRAAVAAGTGLTRGTVSSLVAELIELKLVRETDGPAGPRRIGRPGVAIELSDAVGALGLEVNVDYLAVCIEDLRGGVRHERRELRDNRDSAPGPVLDRLARMATAALSAAENADVRVVGIALALPGLVRKATGTLLWAPNLDWSEIDVVDELRARLGAALPITADNEANLAAIAEHWHGAAAGLRSFALVFGEVGVGGGIFVDGELFRGAHGFGGEIGHVTVDPNGEQCACGSRGCLETVAGLEAIARRACIETSAGERPRSVTGELVRRAVAADAATLAALAEVGTTLGTALASTINLFDPEGVVLGGIYGPLAPWLLDGVEHALRQHVLSTTWSQWEVRSSTLGEGAAVRGAAALTLRRVLEAPSSVAVRETALEAALR